MRVVSWNVAGVGGIKKDRIGRICGKVASVRVDVLLLQEVPVDKKPVKRLSAELGNLGLEYWVFSGRAKPGRKKYGSAIASRYPLLEAERGWADGAPFPELMARATADMEGRAVDVISVHIPNGRGNGWKKIETLEVLGGVLRSAARMPRVVGGSFNEPMRFEPERVVVPWACKEDDLGNPNWRGRKRHKKGGEHPRARWEAAVRLVLDAEPWTGLAHAYLHREAAIPPPTHFAQGDRKKPRCYDHLLVGGLFIDTVGYYTDWLAPELSDHAAAWTEAIYRQF